MTSPSKRICPTPIWNGFRLARCSARGSIRHPTPASEPRTVPQPVSSRSQIDLRPRPGPVPCRVADAACCCLPPQRRRYSNRVLAWGPCPQVLQRHPGVAKGTSIDPLARGPSTEPLLGQGHVARLSGTGVKPVSCRCFGWISARHPRREASRWHPGMAKRVL